MPLSPRAQPPRSATARPRCACARRSPPGRRRARSCGCPDNADAGHADEVAQQRVTRRGADRLRVELHTLDGKLPMTHAHDQAVVAPGGDFQRVREPGSGDHKRVVSGRHERVIEPVEHAGAGVMHGTYLAVHNGRRAHHLASKGNADRLVAEADAEHRDAAAEVTHEVNTDASFLGGPGPWRHHDRGRTAARNVRDRERVVALHDDRRPKLAQVLHEVEGERVVVVDDEHRTAQPRTHAFASSTARICAATLLSISTVSSRTDESATIPAAACTYATPSRTTMVRSAIAVSRSPL